MPFEIVNNEETLGPATEKIVRNKELARWMRIIVEKQCPPLTPEEVAGIEDGSLDVAELFKSKTLPSSQFSGTNNFDRFGKWQENHEDQADSA